MNLDYVANKKNLLILIFFETFLILALLRFIDLQMRYLVLISFIWIILNYVTDKFHNILEYKFDKTLKYLIKTFAINFLVVLILSFFQITDINYIPLKNLVLIIFYFSLINIFIEIGFISVIQFNLNKRKKWLVIEDKTNLSENYFKKFKSFTDDFKFIFIDEKDIKNYFLDESIRGIICDHNYISILKKEILKTYNFEIISTLMWFEIYLFRIPTQLLNSENLSSNFFKINSYYIKTKRLGDFILASIILIISLPLIIIFGLTIFLEDRGPIIYSQIRTGYLGKSIKIYKLRTMRIDAEKNGAQWSNRGDPRITKIGRFLRISRIDELPQLISVLKGDMSLIGPRPERPEIESSIIKNIPNYSLRTKIKPGLSGWAQVNYPYGASMIDAENKLNFDLYYLKNISFWIDLLIIAKTIRLVFNLKGALSKT